jgi:hypothetical protein
MVKNTFQYLFGLSLPIVTHLFPHPTQVTTVVGEPLIMPRIEEPTKEQVDHYLNAYIEHVQHLFHRYRPIYAPQSEPMITIL